MDILVKVSGSLVEDERFYDWLSLVSSSFNKLFVLCGGGESITKILKEREIPYEFGPQGREIKSIEGKRLAQQVLEEERNLVESKLEERGIDATVFIPVVEIGGKIFHINGDSYAIAMYPNFDKIYIVTLKGRTKSFPENLNKIKVVYL
jgi:acetylglutamate kinase